MASSAVMKLACAIFVCMALAAPLTEAAITCGTVASKVGPCLTYLKSKGGPVPAACCGGVRALNAAAATTPDRQTACKCLKSYASVPGINLGLAAALPGKCGVNVPYKISPSTDCSTVR